MNLPWSRIIHSAIDWHHLCSRLEEGFNLTHKQHSWQPQNMDSRTEQRHCKNSVSRNDVWLSLFLLRKLAMAGPTFGHVVKRTVWNVFLGAGGWDWMMLEATFTNPRDTIWDSGRGQRGTFTLVTHDFHLRCPFLFWCPSLGLVKQCFPLTFACSGSSLAWFTHVAFWCNGFCFRITSLEHLKFISKTAQRRTVMAILKLNLGGFRLQRSIAGFSSSFVLWGDFKSWQVGYCPDGYFWIAPKCRADTSKCFAFFTGGDDVWLQLIRCDSRLQPSYLKYHVYKLEISSSPFTSFLLHSIVFNYKKPWCFVTGEYRLECVGSRWWLAIKIEGLWANPWWRGTAKIPPFPNDAFYVTSGGRGYGLIETMQKSAKWNIPLAIAVGATYSLYTQLPTMHTSMFYWWVSWKQLIWKVWARSIGAVAVGWLISMFWRNT